MNMHTPINTEASRFAITQADDDQLLAAFAEWAKGLAEFDKHGDIDNEQCPFMAAWRASLVAMDTAPLPATKAGAAAMLRFGLATTTSDREEQDILAHGEMADRVTWVRENWVDFPTEVRPFWGALYALEAAGHRIAADPADVLMPAAWESLLGTYRAAKGVEDAYDATHITPPEGWPEVGPERTAALKAVPAHHWEEVERLQEIRHDAEDELMAHPAPDLAGFAIKFLIAYGDDRDANGWNDMLEAEAKRLLGGEA